MARTLLLLLAGALTLQGLLPLLPEALAGDGLARLVLTQSSLPRLAMALLAGFLLSMAGEVCQRIFANPLAEPGLLGISGGASLALAAGLLLAPALWQAAPGLLALTGAAGALILVLAVAWGRGLHSQALVLAGVMVNLCAAAAHALLVLFNHDFLQELLTWQAGSLAQAGWQSGLGLLAQTAPVAGALWLLHRPLQLLMLGEETAQGLGLSVRRSKLLLLAAAAWLTASVVATVGLIGFVGLAGPALARGLGGRSGGGSRPNLPRAGLWGAVVLLLADQTARLLSGLAGDVPVGAASGVFIGPLLVLLSLRSRSPDLPARHDPPAPARPRRPMRALLPLALAVPVLLAIALLIGRSETGLHLTTAGDLAAVLHWRLPPLMLAAGAGACLALSGLLLQRLLRNPLTSPDLLGVGHGAGLAFALAMVFLPESGLVSRFALTTAGAGAMLALVSLLAARARFAPSRLLLIGVGLGSTAQALLTLVLAAGGPKGAALLSWFSGSTGGASLPQALLAWSVAVAVLAAALLLRRWFDLLALDEVVAAGRGLAVTPARAAGLALAALAAAAGTIALGPISFVGLIVPHLVATMGFRATAPAALASVGTGALVMVFAQWLGGLLAWPWPISPGLLAALLGGPFFLWQLRKHAA
ncbi:Fe(3+)-hydroxamate ABC transporter permease FhuB [Cereibacter changlensis JA139]|uniref:Fe(3+)-hydroxamate ABC transporter permease FhuB n=2 Tax=Cereibacter changlensis TaxID=402884 RepID=A0A2T4JQN5_9RHOB|nr:Fe(3+)-hydroxamate ABC transporter permease FhuB [Cereibacter changlensis]PTE20097.1 Fe(3+)-hydroxamate ABC transporter permease FhuB [Cereibacter changlensis JA139]PZX47031.1 iron complex transport system permease protein [Cereibacter changlensis]